MRPIAQPNQRIRESYTVVIIGSGYGGSVLGSRLARAGVSVAILERGREFVPGAFPRTLPESVEEFTVDAPDGKLGRENGLYWARLNDDISVVSGSGLGGTSLINANVSLRPDARVFRDGLWPNEIAEDDGALLDTGYARATAWLNPNPYPDDAPRLPKLEAHRKSAAAMGLPFVKVPINVTFQDRLNAAGVQQAACTLCGDCVSGCNYGSKNTLRMNYLPDAAAHGAEIYCEVEARSVAASGGRWRVNYRLLGVGREGFEAPDSFVHAEIVILAAGALGSTELLLRSRAEGLPVSSMLGAHFTGNADTLGFAFATRDRIDAAGFGRLEPGEVGPVGPCITSMIDGRDDGDGSFDEMILEEGNIPGPIASATITMLEASAAVEGERTTDTLSSRARALLGELDTAVRGTHHGVASHSQVYLGIGMDDDEGQMLLIDDRLSISWPGVGTEPMFQTINARMKGATAALEGTFVRDPVWTKVLGRRLVTVHPLGGCAMADSANAGVVNHKHLVYTGEDPRSVHDGLYVVDGSVVPSPLSVNPLLTITALAERCAMHIARDYGWSFDAEPRREPLPEPAAPRVGLRFTETMHGWVASAPDAETGARLGQASGSSLRFVLTMQTSDLDATLTEPTHPMGMTGTVEASRLSSEALTVNGGLFQRLVADPAQPGVFHSVYQARMETIDGHIYFMEGRKNLRDDPGVDLWSDYGTLLVTIHDGPDPSGPELLRGILRMTPTDFARQLTTVAAVNAPGEVAALAAVARFGASFFGDLWRQHGPTGAS